MSEFKRKFPDVSVSRMTNDLQTGSLGAFSRGRERERQLPVRIEREREAVVSADRDREKGSCQCG
jgi:hypothetical protein